MSGEPVPPSPVRLVIECREAAMLPPFQPGPRFEGQPWGTPSLRVRDPEFEAPPPVPLPAPLGLLLGAIVFLAALGIAARRMGW